ncbi:hypothetical protein [Candidatus Stoquefichus sp. SB1]|jgi:hypothetical protein|uniref:Uncharacterized protein n=1 Tax=Caudovirales sp. ct7oE3 TaxID=2826768 RepID=A0A8S5LZH8_9CAUD|nr:hypothetical protein [Candidatus Stoquefichus sp. SB1]DAD75380.1 MAG TPA: hypothetical protein [Caudovirales sp. ct7oE3]
MTSFCTVDGYKFDYLANGSNTHLHIVIYFPNMIRDKGSMLIYGNMNGSLYLGIIGYNKNGSASISHIVGTGCSINSSGLESENGVTWIRIILNINQYSAYGILCVDPFETAHTA